MTQKVLVGDDEERILAREGKSGLIFVDIGMPKRDGYQVCRALRRTQPPRTSR